MASTPPPPDFIDAPPAPLYGPKYDNNEPYFFRKTTRKASGKHYLDPEPSSPSSSSTPKPKRIRSARLEAAPTSPSTSGQVLSKNHHIHPENTAESNSKSESHPLITDKSSISADTDSKEKSSDMVKQGDFKVKKPAALPKSMLPTPAKTPRKQPKQERSTLSSTARRLFSSSKFDGRDVSPTLITGRLFVQHDDDVMPMPRKARRNRENNGFSLDSFAENSDNATSKIDIYTDSCDRIPELDESEDNPFYTKKGREAKTKKAATTKRRHPKESKTVKANEELDCGRDDGLYYNFRGKKTFRTFQEIERMREVSPLRGYGKGDDESGILATRSRMRGITQPEFDPTSVKPRILFPTAEQKRAIARRVAAEAIAQVEEDDNTAETKECDAEDSDKADTLDAVPVTPTKSAHSSNFMISPPLTKHRLRSTTEHSDRPESPTPTAHISTPDAPRYSGKVSPFAHWQRSKCSTPESDEKSAAKGRKRGPSAITPIGDAIAKRTRSHT